LKKYKSVDHLLQALPAVLRQVPDLKLLIVGEGDDRSRLEEIAGMLGVSKAVEFTGFVSEEKKVELLQTMWFKVTTSSKEGWGLTVLEANACGTPVLASNVPGLRDAVKNGETGLLYPYGNVEELGKSIVSLTRDQALRERLTNGALAWAAKFRWDTAAEQTLALLQERIVRSTA
jgi:glycosyltransferase involved in cell wall biosynthesis